MIHPIRCLPLLLLAGACATGGASTGSTPAGDAFIVQNTQNITQTGGANNIAIGTGMTSVVQAFLAKVPYTADKAFNALASAYAALAIPVTTMVTKDRMLGNLDLKARGRLGSLQMRRLLECGAQMGEPNSDSFQITMSVSSEVKDDGDGSSTVATLVQATGRPVAFAGIDVHCSSTGELERLLTNTLKLKLAEQR